MKQLVKALLPAPLLRRLEWCAHRAHYLWYAGSDAIDTVLRRRGELEPPRRLRYVVGGAGPDFHRGAQNFLRTLVDREGLKPDSHVLDVGCGVGRMALALREYLAPAGRYEGFDAWPAGVEWCQAHITPRYPNFRFQTADLYNEFYAPRGRYRPSVYRFPYEDGSFDFAIMLSVLTHLLPDDMENYLAETVRVLRAGGCCLITYYIFTPQAQERIEAGRAALDFRYDCGRHRSLHRDVQARAVAYDEQRLRDIYARLGLEIREPIERGSWSGVDNPTYFQDTVVAVKNQ
jgi:SAM-dependent methyltransferase